jgi:hypothetical protein
MGTDVRFEFLRFLSFGHLHSGSQRQPSQSFPQHFIEIAAPNHVQSLIHIPSPYTVRPASGVDSQSLLLAPQE